MEEYLTAQELSHRIKFSKQTLYNLIYKGTLVLGKHYLKPTPKKILFKWSEIQLWMERPLITSKNDFLKANIPEIEKSNTGHTKSRSLINI